MVSKVSFPVQPSGSWEFPYAVQNVMDAVLLFLLISFQFRKPFASYIWARAHTMKLFQSDGQLSRPRHARALQTQIEYRHLNKVAFLCRLCLSTLNKARTADNDDSCQVGSSKMKTISTFSTLCPSAGSQKNKLIKKKQPCASIFTKINGAIRWERTR